MNQVLTCLRVFVFTVFSFSISFVASPSAIADDSADAPPKPLEPKVAAASDEAQQALGGFQLPSGWQGQLFAAEPDVANIVVFSLDNQGRAWVCESYRQSSGVTDNRGHDETWLKADLAAQTVADRIAYHKRLLGPEGVKQYQEQDDRIRLVEDTDGDGKADQSKVFVSGFNRLEDGTGAGVLVHRDAVYYTCIPKLWKFLDKDHDGVADERIVMSDGYGVRVAFRGHDMHGLIIGPDGRLYFSIGDRGYHLQTAEGKLLADPASGAVFRCELDGSHLEVFATGLRNPQELAFDKFGNLFTGDNNSDSGDKARWVYVVEGGDTGWRMHYQYLPDRGPFNREKIWHPFHPEQPAYIVPPIENVSDGPSGLAYYPGTGLGDRWENTFFLADFRGTPNQSGIRAIQVEPEGAFFKLKQNEKTVWNILATDLAFAPDGSIYISDWVDGWVGEGKGRIYRFFDPVSATSDVVLEVKRLLGQDWSKAAVADLAKWLSHADQRVRQNAQWELADRGEAQPFVDAVQKSRDTVARLHGVWGLSQTIRLHAAQKSKLIPVITNLLDDQDGYIRAAAAQALGEHGESQAAGKLTSLLSDADARVQHFAAIALSKLGASSTLPQVVTMLEKSNNADPVLRHAGIVALEKLAPNAEALTALKSHANTAVRRAAVVALRRRGEAAIAEYLSDSDPLVVAEAARAIHDRPIPAALPALAKIANRAGLDDETAFRALNACYRLGGEDNVAALAKFAGADHPNKLRLEAIEMLGAWAEPDARDRVINDWRPIEPRAAAPAIAALKQALPTILNGPTKIQEAATKVATQYGITEIVPTLLKQVKEAKEPGLRGSALRALAKLDATQAKALIPSALKDKAVEVRVAALEATVSVDPKTATTILVEHTRSEATAERQKAWQLLGQLKKQDEAKQALQQGVKAYLADELPNDVWLDVLQASDTVLSDELRQQLKQQEQQWTEKDPLDAWRWAVAGGNVEEGRNIFLYKTEVSCVRCHKVGKQGGEVGPELTELGAKRDAKYLLEAVVLPNAKIAEGFETVVLVDDLGAVHTGVLRGETDAYVEIITADGATKRIEKETIEARRKGNSAMPADLEKHLKREDLRDLVAYLVSLRGGNAKPAGHE